MVRPRLAALLVLPALVAGACSSEVAVSPSPTSQPLRYVSLGDSYPAGEGLAGPVEPCGRTPGAYPSLLAQRARLAATFHACNGATTDDVLDRERHPGEGRQIDMVVPDADVVTLSIGGNDIGFGPVVTECVLGRQSCVRFEGRVTAELADLGPRLERIYRDVRSRAPDAKVLVVGYPQLAADPALSGLETCAGMTTDEVRWVRQKGDELGLVIRAATETAGVRYLDAAAAFAGHEACTNEPWMEGVHLTSTLASFHPNAAGHDQLARLVERALAA